MSHLDTDMVRLSPPESVTDGQSLASSVNKQPQAWGHYIEKLNTQLDELISRNEALLTADEITQKLRNELNQARTKVIQLQEALDEFHALNPAAAEPHVTPCTIPRCQCTDP